MKLSELLNERKGDRSYEALERDCGGVPKAARLQQIATKPPKTFPDPDSIRGLARGLRVPERVVLAAAAESLGFLMPQAPSRLEQWIPSERVEDLSPKQIDVILGMIEAMTSDEPVSRYVDGGALLFVPNVEAAHGPGEGLLRDVLDAAFPEAYGAELAAHVYLAKWVGPYLWALADRRPEALEYREVRAHPLPSAAREGVVAAVNHMGMTIQEWRDAGQPDVDWVPATEALVPVAPNERAGEEHAERSAPTKSARGQRVPNWRAVADGHRIGLARAIDDAVKEGVDPDALDAYLDGHPLGLDDPAAADARAERIAFEAILSAMEPSRRDPRAVHEARSDEARFVEATIRYLEHREGPREGLPFPTETADYGLAARRGVVENPRSEAGEESQDPGGDDPA